MMAQTKAALRRLGEWTDHFETVFFHEAQRGAAQRYVEGLCGPSEAKRMSPMLEHLSDPGHYQSLQHFITTAKWDAGKAWMTLRRLIPERTGILLIDDTGLPKQGRHSVGVQRQYSGTLGKIGNCQVAVSSVLWTPKGRWLLAAELYLPETWCKDKHLREEAGIPRTMKFRPKWQISIDQIDQILLEDLKLECVVADAGYGSNGHYRAELARRSLNYVVGVEMSTTVWTEEPEFVEPKPNRMGRPRTRRIEKHRREPMALRTLVKNLPDSMWRVVHWRNGTGPRRKGRFAAMRVSPVQSRKMGQAHPEVWLLIEKRATETKCYFSNLPPETSLVRLVELAKARWAVELNYRDLKSGLGFDHFAGRRFRGWNHHAVLTAIAYAFLEFERRRGTTSRSQLTFPFIRNFIQRIFVALDVASDEKLYALVRDVHDHPEEYKRQ